jgi:hypothetical protein
VNVGKTILDVSISLTFSWTESIKRLEPRNGRFRNRDTFPASTVVSFFSESEMLMHV